MKRTIRFVVLIIAFVVASSSNLWAISNSDIIINVLPNSDAGTVSVKDGGIEAVTGGTKVTIVVSPASGYSISKGNILVEKMVNPTNHAPSRAPGLSNDLQVTDEGSNNFSFVIPTGYDGAYVTATFYSTPATGVTPITSLSQITDLSKKYEITADIDASGFTSLGEFTGELDGKLYKIYNLSEPLFTSTSGSAVIRNIIFENVSINVDADWVTAHSATAGDAGAVTSIAGGDTRIYNCGILPTYTDYDTDGSVKGFSGSSVGGTGNVGGFVGKLSGNARVINCYSYANITGGSNVGGIVGNNSVASTQATLTTMVMNCMFYGNISGSTISPIYGGTEINNVAGGMNNYNYYRYGSRYSAEKLISKYNRALAMEEKFITRFERYRLLLNSNKKLAAKYASTASITVNPNDMAKWVLETADRTNNSPMPYPVLKAQGKYPSIINYDAKHAPDSASVGRLNGGKVSANDGKLAVTILKKSQKTDGGQTWPTAAASDVQTTSLTLIRTDKDTTRFNFNYDKVQLPYYNDVGTGNYTENRVVTGWKIVAITGGTEGTYTETDAWDGYNFADRKCTNKDLYDGKGEGKPGSDRVFSQGAYWDVPKDVTAITIEPYWAIAKYVSDETYDVVYNSSYTKQTFTPFGTQYSNGAVIDIYDDGSNDQQVYTSISAAIAGFNNTNKTVYDQAVVLVGNVHQEGAPTNDNKPYTVMSIDMNHDNEPDYSYIFGHSDRQTISPIRYDFLNIVGIAEAQIPKGATKFRNVSIFKPKGWFEITNTCVVHFEQFEYDNGSKSAAPLILLGGTYKQFVSTKVSQPEVTTYIHVGGNAWFAKFGNGTHSDGSSPTKHIPISVTGGDYDEFYLSGTYQPTVTAFANDPAECYVSGGRFGEMAGASLEQIDGNVRWQIDWADITNFFGGGINANKPITGSIQTDITNSHVALFCGGPKFGDMSAEKTVITNASSCTFGTYCGAGYGGTSLNRVKYWDASALNPKDKQSEYSNDRGKYFDGATTNSPGNSGQYGKKGKGVATDFDYDFFYWSKGDTGGRFYVKFASFSLATTNGVTSTLNRCNITGNFYGGGYLGKVAGTATSTLDSCKVDGSVYGGGYSASLPPVYVRKTPAFTKDPAINNNIGMFEMGEINGFDTYQWKYKATADMPANGDSGMESSESGNFVYTDEDLTSLGSVGNTVLTISGTTTVGGSVYGGGEESGVDSDTEVTVSGGTIGTEGNGGVEYGNVYGGGKGKRDDVTAGLVKGSTKVTIQNTVVDANTTIKPTIYHNVYGGGAYGSVGDFEYHATTGVPTGLKTTAPENSGKTEVYIKGGTFGWNGKENGMVFGSSRGDVGAPEAIEDKLAWVYDTHVAIGDTATNATITTATPIIKGSVYGGGENGHNLNNSYVRINGGTIGISEGEPVTSGGVEYSGAAYPYRGNVYGGGCGTDKYYLNPSSVPNPYDGNGDKYNPKAGVVRGNAFVNITAGYIVHNVYGAGAMGSVGTEVAGARTKVNISGGRVGYDGTKNGNVFGAARGEYGESTAASNLANVPQSEVNISYTTTPTADNEGKTAQLIAGSVFGGGEAGTVKGSVAVNMTGGLILKDLYGGGALADTQTSNWNTAATPNTWADADKKSALNTTTIRLTGGRVVEEVFGGGLGEEGKPAYVWGDVLLDLNGTTPIDGTTYKPSTTGTATTNAAGCVVGQFFGGNNINGTPKGDVMVHVYATQNKEKASISAKFKLDNESSTDKGTSESDDDYVARLKEILADKIEVAEALGLTVSTDDKNLTTSTTATADDLKTAITTVTTSIGTKTIDEINGVHYDVKAVYGGGNQAAYIPVSPNTSTTSTPNGAQTQVIIEGCDYTSIETVYGGGNAAAVPETNVDVRSAYEIGMVFGGGNGYSATDNHSNPSAPNYNPGADVGVYKEGSTETIYGTGNANAVLKGGLIHEAYGGSNQKGNIKGKININTAPVDGGCDLCVDKLVGAGKNADVDGDLIMVLGCKPTTKTPLIFAGADNADVNGNVELTITSGTFGQVFGGNNLGGAIKGHLVLNIEETGCNPIRIDELYLGGNQAAYSVYGYYLDTSDNKVKPRTAAMHAIAEGQDGYVAPLTNPDNDATHSFPYAQPVLNVISATSIGKVFGGGLGEGAVMHADPTVNINMIKGTATGSSTTNLGTIGDVFGGGNEASVFGNPTVNIGTEMTVTMTSVDADDPGTTDVDEKRPKVLGANITGNVFGGGNEAKVSGNTYVNICGTQNPVLDSENNPVLDSDGKPTYTDTFVDHSSTTGFSVSIGNSVYGGGNKADVEGNTFVTMADGYVFNGIFGGGLAGSVGTFTRDKTVTLFGHTPNHDDCIGKPTACESGTGTCYVVVSGGQIGPIEVATLGMKRPEAQGGPVPQGWVWGGGCGIVEDPADDQDTHFKAYVNNTDVTIKRNAFILESIIGGGEFGRVLGNTLVKIKGGQIGVGEGMVDNGKPVRYTDGQFVDPTDPSTTITAGLATCSHFPFGKEVGGKKVYECYDPYADAYKAAHFGSELYPGGVTDGASDGKTWIGCVFAGGSGYMPYVHKDGSGNVIDYDWVSSAGWVEGNTEVRISGGHILTNVYGGNEYTDVKGTSKVIMTGGTVGVPRTKEQIEALPMSGYIYGAGKGDERTHFNTATNVGSAEVEVSGGIVYGSVYGGGEDGHVLGDVKVTIKEGAKIGSCGTSYFDGHVFGGGRGLSGIAQTAGTVGGNVEVNIEGGKMLGSIYGGGRLASVGTQFTAPEDDDYGNFKEDDTNGTYGHVTVNISGGTIGKLFTPDTDGNLPGGAQYSGNVYGGSMGRLTLLNGDTISIWPKMAQVKYSAVNIYGTAEVRRSVYGGGELGTVRDDAYVTIGGYKTGDADTDGDVAITKPSTDNNPIVRRDVYGGGYGSDRRNYTVFTVKELESDNQHHPHTYAFTPMQFAGCVGKNTYVNIAGGYIRKSVYGGGELASVGVINYRAAELTSGDSKEGKVWFHDAASSKDYYYTNMVKHEDATKEFALSWPYEFNYVDGYPGATHVKVTGGRLGLKDGDTDTGFDDNGDVYGAGKGMAGDYKDYVFCANVGSTDVKIDHAGSNDLEEYDGTKDLIAGAVYGGGEDGHVMGNTKVTMKKGFVYHSIYGAGSGKGKYEKTLSRLDGAGDYTRKIYSITAGKVFGNSTVEMSGGMVVRNVYGGGNMGSVGKGNYAGGTDDYSYYVGDKTYNGYGEALNGSLWDGVSDNSKAFLNSGKCTVRVTGGTIGYIDTTDPSSSMYPYNSSASLPYGNVFGGCRGESAPNITETPRYQYSPEFFVGYANETEVTIEGTTTKILGSVYGGGMDGHVRRDAHVIIKGGEIGIPYNAEYKGKVQTEEPNDIQWLARGNVYGAGSGIGKYKYDFNYNDKTSTDANGNGKIEDNEVEVSTYHGNEIKEEDYSTSAGSVTRFTKVEIEGGTIHRNVYGGGSLASIGAPKIPTSRTDNPVRRDDDATGTKGKQSLNEVVISGGKIGDDYSYNAGNHVYGGHVFGGSRGDASLNSNMFSTSVFTSVSINATNSPTIYGSVFGGGEVGIVKGSVDVTMNGGTVNDDVYGGGALANTNTENSSSVPYTTTVNLYGGMIKGDAYGGGLGQLGVTAVTGVHWTQEEIDAAQEGDPAYGKTTDDWKVAPVAGVEAKEALVYGNVAVNLGNTERTTATGFEVNKFTEGVHAGIVKSGRVFGCNNLNGSPQGSVTVTVNKTVKGNTEKTASGDLKSSDATKHTYHVAAVYGGGNLAGKTVGGSTNVIINGCDVSIRDVYGGGNAAEVPATDVLVNGAYEIEHVFGGGNGKDDYTLDGGTTWTTNPGANVNGNTNTLLLGGLIHEAYGGSNEKGTISGSVNINTAAGQPADCSECPLDVEKIVGAGKNADVNGDLIMVLGCKPTTKTPLVFGGADNANVNGNVELTITSGTFGQVFGGNNLGGVIRGHITLNIEETGCNPIKIDELYLGGNNAAYSIYGYYNAGDDTNPDIKPRTAEMEAVGSSNPGYNAPVGNPSNVDGKHPFPYAQPVLNVVSCTSIGKVFGGGLGTGAIMHADPTVNINMIPGDFANDEIKGVPYVMNEMNLSSDDNPNKLGIIGDVYGGGNAADVIGNPTVNIGTAATVQLHESYTNGAYSMSGDRTVLGAYINGNVFGAGMGKADEFTCAKAMVGEVDKGIDAENNPLPGGTTVVIAKGTVNGSVYGGGEVGRVERNTKVTIGLEGDEASAPIIKGSVFGAGQGLETHGYSALVRGNAEVVIQGKAQVWQNVHGGGEKASVGRYNVRQPGDTEHPEVRVGMPYSLKAGGKCTVIIQDGATIGKEANTGDVYGAGQGVTPNYINTQGDANRSKRMVTYTSEEDYPTADEGKTWDYYADNHHYVWEYFTTKDDYLLYMETLARASETDVIIGGKRVTTGEATSIVASSLAPTIKGSVYGGSESGFVYYSTEVNIPKGTVKGDAFGGGKGLATYAEAGRVRRNTHLIISGGAVEGNVYGGGSLGDVGTIEKSADYNYKWKKFDGSTYNTAENNQITGENTNTGICTVEITDGTIGTGVAMNGDGTFANGNVFGAGRGLNDTWWCEKATAFATNVNITNGTVKGTVYGGGEVGRVEDDAKVTIGVPDQTGETKAPVIVGNVFGAGAGLATHGYSALVRGNAAVTVQGTAQIGGSVYGGGEIASVGRFHVVGGLPTKPESGGYCTVTIQDKAKIGSDGTGHDVFGACKGVTPAYDASNYKNVYSMQTYENRPSDTPGDTWDYYTTYPEGYKGQKFIKRYYKTETEYLAFLKTLALTSHPYVTIAEDATVNGSVYGGGQRGVTLGRVDVNIMGGSISQDVYGGGALADTNLGNWDENGYVVATALNEGELITSLYTRSGSGTTESPYVYTKITDAATDINSGTYYRQQATWSDASQKSAHYTTKVNILGGTIGGDAYGGGLGQLEAGTKGQEGYLAPIEAKVYGDVYMNLNGFDKNEVTYDANVHGATGDGDRLELSGNEYRVKDTVKGAIVSRIFGCNNLNGSPQGKVKVHVFKTQRAGQTRITNGGDVTTAKVHVSPVGGEYDFTAYDVQAVYGGGNMAAYVPKELTDAKTQVIIDGCDRTSIGQVYGGGNAASTPATEVTVNGTFEIAEVFGGGNGKDKITLNGVQKDNPGANVGFYDYSAEENTYNTKEKRTTDPELAPTFISKYVYGSGKAAVNIYGGTIHRVFGGSNTKGNVRQSAITLLEEAGGCDFCVDEAYGGGKSAPMDAEAKLLMACIPGLKAVYGGAQAADVYDDVTVTVTNGNFDRVFGGNNLSGTIRGKITVNVEETGCRPVIIGELYGGGNQAGYSVYGYNEDGSMIESGDTPLYQDPQVNVRSFTSIGNIYGGGYGTGAKMVGNPTVNINVVEGDKKDYTYANDASTYKVGEDNVPYYDANGFKELTLTVDDHSVVLPSHTKGKIGAINNVFGGGNAAEVIGNTNVNVGTLAEVYQIRPVAIGNSVANYYTRSGEGTESSPYIYTQATGNAVDGTTYYEKKTVLGADIRGNVYGGGNNAEVTGNTNVNIGKKEGE